MDPSLQHLNNGGIFQEIKFLIWERILCLEHLHLQVLLRGKEPRLLGRFIQAVFAFFCFPNFSCLVAGKSLGVVDPHH